MFEGSLSKYHELMKTIKKAEEKMVVNKVIKTYIINYAKTNLLNECSYKQVKLMTGISKSTFSQKKKVVNQCS